MFKNPHVETIHRARKHGDEITPEFMGSHDIIQPRPQPVLGERRDDRNRTLSEIEGDAARRAAVLALACRSHDAESGVPCFRSARSETRGFCLDRWVRGVAVAQRVVFGSGVAR